MAFICRGTCTLPLFLVTLLLHKIFLLILTFSCLCYRETKQIKVQVKMQIYKIQVTYWCINMYNGLLSWPTIYEIPSERD